MYHNIIGVETVGNWLSKAETSKTNIASAAIQQAKTFIECHNNDSDDDSDSDF